MKLYSLKLIPVICIALLALSCNDSTTKETMSLSIK
jgi:hypothetical protein